ncbi:unnamed protein product [Lepeophtheirus salmonis]|uniref:(salmon louse) hypothetical protein n=1 Tax=Lepeophtheirus salmonis TaxID=72036 RepID=A0A7R8D6I5_LEPSM|nr:unnamed protein product [Lepeophtheirus salmonis]CAF3017895.1 unnamed protein product [Lepeophtheirus salmonis]
MRFQHLIPFLIFGIFSTLVDGSENEDNKDHSTGKKKEKVFSLFSVVQFRNTVCAIGSGASRIRNGTCLKQSECADRGGSGRANCASGYPKFFNKTNIFAYFCFLCLGFGVCCFFAIQTCGSVARENCTYIQNPGFPTPYRVLTPCSYTIQRCSNNVCRLRLDFEMFTTFEPAGTIETDDGGVCNPRWDQFSVQNLNTGNPMNSIIPVICGENTGQHIYIDIGNQDGDSASLNFAFRQEQRDRVWDIKVTQIPCNTIDDPPAGCLQYLKGTSGRFTTFNFNILSSQHLGNQNYRICIRRELGHCCIQYIPCANEANSFSIGGTNLKSAVDTDCSTDYINIPNASNTCGGANLSQRFCSKMGILGFFNNANANTEVCCKYNY